MTAIASGTTHADEILLGYLSRWRWAVRDAAKTNLIAAQMAVDEINAAGGMNGKKIKIVSFDTAGNPDQAVVGLRKLAEDDKVMAIIGPFSSGECRVAFPAAEREGIVTMSMASSAPKLAEPFTYALRNTSDEGYLFEHVMKTLKEKGYPMATGAVAYATDDVISKTMGEIVLPNVMKASGVDMKASVTFQTQAFDLSAQVSQLMASPTDLVGVGSGPEAAVRLAQEMRRQGHKGRLVAGSTIADSELPSRMGENGNGTTIPTTFFGGVDGKAKNFDEEFVKRAKAAGIERSAASQFDAATYDIVHVLCPGHEGEENHRRSVEPFSGTHRHTRFPAFDAALPSVGRAGLVRQERRCAKARLHHRNAEREMEPDRKLSRGLITPTAALGRMFHVRS